MVEFYLSHLEAVASCGSGCLLECVGVDGARISRAISLSGLGAVGEVETEQQARVMNA